METTVHALLRALIRHLLLGLLFVAAAIALFDVALRLAPREPHRPPLAFSRVSHPVTGPSAVAPVPVHDVTLEAVAAFMVLSAALAYYHLWQFRGKTRRYLNQRHRAANESLRQDFHRTHRV